MGYYKAESCAVLKWKFVSMAAALAAASYSELEEAFISKGLTGRYEGIRTPYIGG